MIIDELRIGNWLMFNNSFEKVRSITNGIFIDKINELPLELYSPIPITSELLEKIKIIQCPNWKQRPNNTCFAFDFEGKDEFYINLSENKYYFGYDYNSILVAHNYQELKYIHEIQNLFFF